jgi:Xaa-Pro aminopeptidase
MRTFQSQLSRQHLDAALIIGRTATHWLTGFRGTWSFTLVLPRRAVFITDSRYIEAARHDLRGLRVILQGAKADEQLAGLLRQHRVKRLGLEASEPHETWLWVRRLVPRGVRLVNVTPVLRTLRAVKDEVEITAIRRAVRLGDAVFADLLPWLRRTLARRPVTESDIALWLRRAFEDRGAEGPSFPPIVAVGPNSARPHAVPGSRQVRKGTFLLLDFGLVLEGYCSDMTRTIAVGKISRRHERIYETVREAQAAGTAAVRAGVAAREVDAAAREVIRRAGHAKQFGHGTGHGVGIEIHEAPRLNPTTTERLEPGMVVTVEPGIYIPGFAGVRIEDVVVVREGGGETLTQAPKELISV